MDLKNQLENLFPDHNFKESKDDTKISYNQHDSVICKYEKRKGKPITIIEGFTSIKETDKKEIAKRLKTMLSVGGTVKGGKIIIQGNNRNRIMEELVKMGFKVKRVGG
jgi:translation initiation factor 1|tara:strand:- start:1817 stop:2140 length:324 start_codon:yes stop_codon:yes gene_type:complete